MMLFLMVGQIACARCKRKAHTRCAKEVFHTAGYPETPIQVKDLQRGFCPQCYPMV